MKIAREDKVLFSALTSIPNVQLRESVIKSLSPRHRERVNYQVKQLLEQKKSQYKLAPGDSKALHKALRPHARLLKTVGNGRQQKGGWILSFLIATLVPIVTSLISK